MEKFAKITLDSSDGSYFTDDTKRLDGFIAELSDAEIGSKYIIEVVEMPQEEFDALPDFQGF